MINLVKKIHATFLVVASLLAFSLSYQAVASDDVLADIVDSGILKVAMSGDQPPYNMKNREKNLMGFDVDLANALANSLKVQLEIIEIPFGDLMPALHSGKVDMVISGMAITAPRSQSATFIGPYNISGKSMLSTRDAMNKIQESGFNNANNRIIVLENSTSQAFAKQKMSKATIQTISNYDEGVKLLIAGKADALVADMAICKLSVLRNPTAGLVTSKKPLSIEPIGIAIPLGNPKLESLVRNYVSTYERVGLIDGLQEKWFENSNWVIALP